MVLVMHLEIYTACKVVTGLMLYVIITTTTEQQHEWHLFKTAVKKEKRPYVCKIILCVYSHYNDGRHKITVCTIYFKKKFVKADYHLPKVVPAEDAFFSIFHSLGQLLSFFHSFFPFYCFFCLFCGSSQLQSSCLTFFQPSNSSLSI